MYSTVLRLAEHNCSGTEAVETELQQKLTISK